MSLAGWVLFAWWWWIVLQGVGRGPVVFTGIFIGVSFAVVVLINALWTWHNKRIWEQRGARMKVRNVPEIWSQDRLGRAVTFEGSLRRIQTERAVTVSCEDPSKVYRPAAPGGISADGGNGARIGPGIP